MHAVLASDADEKTTRLLAELGTDVNVHDRNQKWTALHFAARDGRTAIVRELLMAGAEPNSVDSFGNTPLMRALMDTPNVESELIKLLLDHGADPDHTNLKGIAPRQFAERMKRVSAIEVFSAIGKR